MVDDLSLWGIYVKIVVRRMRKEKRSDPATQVCLWTMVPSSVTRTNSHILVCHLCFLTAGSQELLIKRQLKPFQICMKFFSVEEKVLGLLCVLYTVAVKLFTEPVHYEGRLTVWYFCY